MRCYAPAMVAFLVILVVVSSYFALRSIGLNSNRTPSSVMIVEVETAIDRALSARYVVDPKKVAALEGFFPNYKNRPKSNMAAGWTASYLVYFSFPDGETIRVVASFREAALWSTGKGDFPVQGNFFDFVEDELKAVQGP